MLFDPSGDYIYFDNLEPVTLQSRTTASTFTSFSIPSARRFQQTDAEKTGESDLQQDRMTWSIWQKDLDTAKAPNPKYSDIIQDASGVQWIVDEADYQVWQSRWLLSTTKAV